jgi:hypothetical protein
VLSTIPFLGNKCFPTGDVVHSDCFPERHAYVCEVSQEKKKKKRKRALAQTPMMKITPYPYAYIITSSPIRLCSIPSEQLRKSIFETKIASYEGKTTR